MQNGAACQETQEYLQDLMDARLPRDQEERIQAHLRACSVCAGELRLQSEIRSKVAAEVSRREVPAQLRHRVREILTPRERWVWGFLPRPALRWGFAVACLALITLVPVTLLQQNRQDRIPLIVVEAVNDYLSFAMRVDPQSVPTADRQQVGRWVETKVGFQVDPPGGQAGDLRLMGGDVTYFLDRKVACLLYGKGPKLVTIFILPGEGVELPQRELGRVDGLTLYTASHQGYGAIFWKRDNFVYSVVSELPQEELLGVAKEISLGRI